MKTVLLGCLLLFLQSCTEKKEAPKVIYEKNIQKSSESPLDTTSLKVADLPVLMDGTSYLIFPIGDIRIIESEKSSYGSAKTNHESYAISNYNRFEIAGYFDNLKFQHTDSTAFRALTNQKIQIHTATFLDQIAAKTKNQILVYTLVDADTNKDGKINQKDIKSLYISRANGTNFTKLSREFHELIDWNCIDKQGKLFFRSIEDTNKNGAFDKTDKMHYHNVNLFAKEWKALEYNPI